jgi:RND family efflux transporter MFP subunit
MPFFKEELQRFRRRSIQWTPKAGTMKRTRLLASIALACTLAAQPVDLVPVVSKPVSRTIELPGEIQPYLSVAIHAKVRGYLERVLVDRGSVVKRGELLAELTAPEMAAQIAEAQSRVQAIESERAQAQAQLGAAQSTAERLQKASQTPGAIAGNELIQAQAQVDAAKALVASKLQASQSAGAALRAQKDLESYLRITAPFDGVVTERLTHPGALVGPGADPVLLIIEQQSRLRLVVAVPEEASGGIIRGARVDFHVPAYPGRTFAGIVARPSHALDEKTRTMPVELDVNNPDTLLSPGMYATVRWPVKQSRPALWVPKTSVVNTTERTFVIRDRDGAAEWVDVSPGGSDGGVVEVLGNLHAGDRVVRRATDEIRPGTLIKPAPKKST